MHVRAALMTVGVITSAVAPISAQTPAGEVHHDLPRTRANIAAWDVAVVERAAAMLASPARWNRSDTISCAPGAKTISIRCALERAIDDAAAESGSKASTTTGDAAATRADCRLTNVEGRADGSCGSFFDEATVFSIARAKGITTGMWRRDKTPSEVWSGQMINPGGPVLQQARRLVDSIAPGKYRNARLAEFNDDPTVTFANVQSFFRSLEAHVRKVTSADLTGASDDVEIELYAGGAGVIRTYNGWYAVSGFSAKDSTIRFQVDTAKEIEPNALDREILMRADALLPSDTVWNRADDRQCPADAKTLSIYCALEQATRELTGGFHHRRPALETVRVLVEERTKGRDYDHRLMDYNNDPSTHLSDVRALFADALARVPR